MFLPTELHTQKGTIGVKALLDSGAEGSFINQRLVDDHLLPTKPLSRIIEIKDFQDESSSMATQQAKVLLAIGPLRITETFVVAKLGRTDLILGDN